MNHPSRLKPLLELVHPDCRGRLPGKSLLFKVGVGTGGIGNIWENVKNAKSWVPDL